MLLLLALSIFTIGALIKEKNSVIINTTPNAKLILYYGDGCTYCKVVEEYLGKNDPENKFKIAQKEVGKNQDNQQEFVEKARACGLDTDKLSIPMLWDSKDSKCYTGDQIIIDFLNSQTAL